MRRKTAILILLAVSAAVLATVLASPAMRFHLRLNHAAYLTNAHRYLDALGEYERLAQDFPNAPGLSGAFEQRMVKKAGEYYLKAAARPGAEPTAYEAFLEAVQRRERLAPLARRMRLQLMAQRDRNTTPTLAAARDILRHEGYDPEAIWWAAYSQYEPRAPLRIPPELIRYREAVEKPAGPDERRSEEQLRREVYLKALLALADHDWAAAADDFSQYRRPNLTGSEPTDLAQGLALMKAGRPEAAAQVFLRYRRANPQDTGSLAGLVEAYLAIPNYPWAAYALDEIRMMDPARENEILKSSFGLPETEGQPLVALCQAIASGGAGSREVTLWSWLNQMARSPEERRAAAKTADALIARGTTRPDERASLLQYCLWRGRLEMADKLTTASTAGLATEALQCQAIGRVLHWYPRRDNDQTSPSLARAEQLNLLLTRNMTQHFSLGLKPDDSVLVLMIQGFPAHGVWPIIHLDLGQWGSQVIYTCDSRTQAQPWIIMLRQPAKREGKIEASVSLLNGGEGGTGARNVMIARAIIF